MFNPKKLKLRNPPTPYINSYKYGDDVIVFCDTPKERVIAFGDNLYDAKTTTEILTYFGFSKDKPVRIKRSSGDSGVKSIEYIQEK